MRTAAKALVFVVCLLGAIATEGRASFACTVGAVLAFIAVIGDDDEL